MAKIKKRRVELMTETHEKLTFRRRNRQMFFCDICNCSVHIISATFVVEKFGCDINQLKTIFLDKQIHFLENTEMICGNSLANYFGDLIKN